MGSICGAAALAYPIISMPEVQLASWLTLPLRRDDGGGTEKSSSLLPSSSLQCSRVQQVPLVQCGYQSKLVLKILRMPRSARTK